MSGATSPNSRSRLARSGLALSVLVVGLGASLLQSPRLRAANEPTVRAFPISRANLETPDGVRRAVASAAASGYDSILVPVSIQPGSIRDAFDGAADAVKEAATRGLQVYLSIDVNRAAAPDDLPGAREHVLYQHPEWLMIPRDLAVEMLHVDSRSPEFVGRLARWTRAHADRADGLYLSPLQPEVVTYLVERVTRVLTQYEVRGVNLDMLRFPGSDFDYSRRALDAFRTEVRAGLAPAERLRMDQVEAIDPFGYPEEFPDQWRQFRQARLTMLVTRLRAAIRAVRPDVVVSASVTSDAERALQDHLQDWRAWLDNRLVDALLQSPPPVVATSQRPAAAGSH